jgi:hypothetical protein
MMSVLEQEHVTQCVGRFCLTVPVSMRRSIGYYEVSEIHLTEQIFEPLSEDSYEQEWLARLATIEAQKEDRSDPDDVYGEILEKFDIGPMMRGVVFQHTISDEDIAVGILLNSGEIGLWLQMEGYIKNQKKMIGWVRELAETYRLPGKNEQLPLPGKDWFYLGRGAIAQPFDYFEKAEVSFDGHPLNVHFKINIETMEDTAPTLMERLANMMVNMVGYFLNGISVEKKGKRKVAGLKGEYLILRDKKNENLSFVWIYPGKPDSGKYPEISILMDTSDEQMKEKIALWNTLLDSVMPITP